MSIARDSISAMPSVKAGAAAAPVGGELGEEPEKRHLFRRRSWAS
jgi:hypothetical protein